MSDSLDPFTLGELFDQAAPVIAPVGGNVAVIRRKLMELAVAKMIAGWAADEPILLVLPDCVPVLLARGRVPTEVINTKVRRLISFTPVMEIVWLGGAL